MNFTSPISQVFINRPWQGTVLGIFSILAFILLGLALIASILITVGGSFFAGYMAQTEGMRGFSGFWTTGLMGSFLLLPMALITIIPLMVLQYYLTKGIFAGQRWTIISFLVLTIIGVLNFNSILLLFPLMTLLYVGVCILLIYLEIKCLKHAFYKAKEADAQTPSNNEQSPEQIDKH